MKEDNNNLTLVVIVFLIMMSPLVLSSCSATHEIAQPSSSTQRYEVSRDTIYQIDSIYVSTHTIIREADSAALAAMGIQMSDMQKSWIIKEESLQREIHSLKSRSSDTTYITDTIWQPYEVEVPVNILSDGQRKQIAGFWFLLVVNIAFVTFKIYRSLKL